MSTARQAGQARSALASVQPSMVEAMHALAESDAETMRAMVTMVASMSANDDPEVGAYASVIAPAMWQARRNDAPLVAVVLGAIGKARRAVALAHGDALEAWDMYGDMADLAVEETARGQFSDDARTTLSHYGTAPADAQYGVTYGDVVETACGMAGAPTLARVAREYLAHERSECCSGAGRRVTLAGVTAHGEKWSADDSRYHSSRRAVLASLRSIDRGAVLAVTGAPGARPTYGRNGVSVGNGSPAHEAPAMWAPVAGKSLPAVTATRVVSVTVDYVWEGPTTGRAWSVTVWQAGAMREVSPRMARRSGLEMVDSLGYPQRLGYGASASGMPGAWRPVRQDVTRVVSVPAREVPGRPVMFGPDVILSCDASGHVTAREMTEAEAEALAAPMAGRAEIVDSGDAPDARPDDSRLGGDVTASGILRSYKPVVSPRKRSGGNTGPTVPASLPR